MLAASDALAAIRDGSQDAVDPKLLSEPALSTVVGGPLEHPKEPFPSRWHFGAWLFRELPRARVSPSTLRVPGVWTWLALYLFDLVRPPGTKVREDARYILNRDDYRKRYRHLVAGPYFVFSAHELAPQLARGLLATPPHAPGDLYEQFASRQELVTSASVMQVVNAMYFDPATSALRRGAGANARRLADVLMQYDVTYDFATVTPDRLIGMLPREFRRFVRPS